MQVGRIFSDSEMVADYHSVVNYTLSFDFGCLATSTTTTARTITSKLRSVGQE